MANYPPSCESSFLRQFWTLTVVLCASFLSAVAQNAKGNLALWTISTTRNDGFLRFEKSAKEHGYDLQVLGMEPPFAGRDRSALERGGKLWLLKEALASVATSPDTVVMYTPNYDVILTEGPEETLKRFREMEADVVFGAGSLCWPNADPEDLIQDTDDGFVDSGGFIGYAYAIQQLLLVYDERLENNGQVFCEHMQKFSLKKDLNSEIFLNLNIDFEGATVKYIAGKAVISIKGHVMYPCVVKAQGQSTPILDILRKSTVTVEGKINLRGIDEDDFPNIFMAIFVEFSYPFIEEFYQKISNLNYPKSKMSLYLHDSTEFHMKDTAKFMSENGMKYHKVEFHSDDSDMSSSKNRALQRCVDVNCQYFFYLEPESHLNSEDTLLELIHSNKTAVAPFLLHPESSRANIWRKVSEEPYVGTSLAHDKFITDIPIGLWNVPCITSCYVLQGHIIPRLLGSYSETDSSFEIKFCNRMDQQGVFMHVDNQARYGWLVDNTNFDSSHLHSDLYDLPENRHLWEEVYLHEEYFTYRDPKKEHPQPCPDVYWQPLLSPKFCQQFIETCEDYGKWGNARTYDERLDGGYDAAPTVDIDVQHIGWGDQFLDVLDEYINPFVEKIFEGYDARGEAPFTFVVRYKPSEQDRLSPHQDASSFSVNVALNQPGVDFQGGGTKFNRYNCSFTGQQIGWALIHPGKVTHTHEGLPTTEGTRYILVSFADP